MEVRTGVAGKERRGRAREVRRGGGRGGETGDGNERRETLLC